MKPEGLSPSPQRPVTCTYNRKEYITVGTIATLCSAFKQLITLNKQQYQADTEVGKVTGFKNCWPRWLKLNTHLYLS